MANPTFDYDLVCLRGDAPPPGTTGLLVFRGVNLARYKTQVALGRQPKNTLCVTCGCLYDMGISGDTPITVEGKTRPSILAVDVDSGPGAGGTTVILTGRGLALAGLVVKFGGVAATDLRAITDQHVTVTTPAHMVGAVDVTVENANGQREDGSGALAGGFTFV